MNGTLTLFDKIASGELKSWTIWENDKHIAFLTPFPNTPGATVVIPKQNIGDDVFEIEPQQYVDLMEASKTVAKLLKKALGVARVALVFEGTGVAYVHSKLYPLHGKLASETNVWGGDQVFTDEYQGWITTLEGPKADNKQMDDMQAKIIEATK